MFMKKEFVINMETNILNLSTELNEYNMNDQQFYVAIAPKFNDNEYPDEFQDYIDNGSILIDATVSKIFSFDSKEKSVEEYIGLERWNKNHSIYDFLKKNKRVPEKYFCLKTNNYTLYGNRNSRERKYLSFSVKSCNFSICNPDVYAYDDAKLNEWEVKSQPDYIMTEEDK
jgi:hypothetical protein